MSVFFTDRDLGLQFPAMLRAAGILVERHCDHFAHDTPDEEWIRGVSEAGWFVLTHNRRIRYTPNELAAVGEAGIGMFMIIGTAAFPALAQNFIITHPKVEHFITSNDPPFIAKIYRASEAERARNPAAPGQVTLWKDF